MSINPQLLEILVCPVTKLPVSMLDSNRLEKLNRLIRDKKVANMGGEQISEEYEEALITNNNNTIYQIKNGIPIMLEDQAIDIGLIPEW